MKITQRSVLSATLALSFSAMALAQDPPAKKAAPRLVLWVSTTAWADGAEIPMRHAARGDNKSPAFEFHWNLGTNPAAAPETLQTYAVIFHDVENSSNKTTADTLPWTAFNIPGTAKGTAEGLGSGDLPDGTRNGPGIAARQGKAPAYFGPDSRTRAAAPLRVRVLRPRHETGSPRQHDTRRHAQSDGRPRCG